MVRLPDAAGQVRNAPVKALRGFFAGIGQLLLAADRFRAEEAERERTGDDEQHDPLTTFDRQPAGHDQAPGQAAAPSQAAPRTRDRGTRDGQPAEQRRFRSLDSTGNVRVLTPAEAAEVSREAGGPAQADLAPQADVSPDAVPVPAVPAARTAPR